MNNEGGLVPTNIADIIDKLNQSLRKFAIKETEWIIQKSKDDTKMAELEGKLKAHENINIDLLKRIRMLEYALSVERTKNAKLISAAGKETDVEELKFNNKLILSDIDDKRELLKEEDLKALKQKSIRPSLLSMLNDIGINEQLANSLFVDLELNKTELERLIKSNMDEKFEEIMKEKNEIETNINNNVPEKDKSQTSQNRESQADNKNSESISSTNERKEIPNLNLTNAQQTELRSHFDVVRKLGYLPIINALVSISEDCSIQIWSLKNLNFANTCNDIDPYIVFRGHTGPLFSLALSPFKNNLIYTAGNEGIIKVWKVPKPEEVAVYGDADLNFNCNVGFFNKSNEVVWDLIHHPNKNLLISLNADSFLYLWETAEAEDYLQSLDELNHEKWFKGAKNRQPMEGGEAANPTCGIFMNSDPNLFICGFNDGYLSTFDIVKTQFTSNLKTFKIDKNDRHHHDKCFYQPNCLTSGTLQTVYGGFEDSTIKSFDLRSADGITNTVNAHNDAVTSLSLLNDLYLFSTSHDTKIKMWDVRNLSSCVQEKIGSQKKWDEAIWHSVLVPNEIILATAGADSWITLFKL